MNDRVAALVLAAGLAKRMGRLKQLLPLGAKPAVRHAVDALATAGISDIVVVCGKGREQYEAALAGSGAVLISNEQEGSEMADSVRAGLGKLEARQDVTGLLVLPADHPLVRPETVSGLIELHHREPTAIVIPRFDGRRGHPTLFPLPIAREIHSRESLRDIVRHDAGRVRTVDVHDAGVALDMDTEEDYRNLCSLYAARTAGQEDRHVQQR
jgi:CTP:molybdopterin cytidylyltransferase MocA